MTVEPIKTIDEAFAIALIRNECRKYLTGNRDIITSKQQTDFFLRTPSGVRPYIVRVCGVPCGYAIIRNHGASKCLTGCIGRHWRGVGLGRELFSRLVRMAGPKVILNVLRSNKRAIRLYESLGFRVYRKTKRVLFMRHYDTAP